MKSFFQNKIAVAVVLLLFGCVKSNDMDALVDEVLTEADGNAGEFETLLNRYDGYDKEIATYAIAAVWGRGARSGVGIDSIEALYRELPVRNSWQFDSAQLERGKRYMAMHLTRTKDAEVITAEYLEENIDDAIRLRDTRLWNKEIPKDIFCEMLLPYRLGDEPLSSWRLPYRTWLAELEDTLAKCNSSVEAAAIISRKIGTSPYNDRLSTPRRSALNLLEAPIGYCREDCDRTLYAMRSMGVPVATDMMLVSPDNGASHSWTVVWDNIDKRTRMFDNSAYTPTRDRIHYDKRRKGKVYRQTFLPDLARIRCYRNAQNPPPQLLNPHLKDVTAEYFGNNKAEMDLWRSDYSTIYLGVFAGKRFQPVDIAVKSGDKAIFTNIEPNLIFAPITSQGEICGYPFMITDSGKVESFVPDYDCRDTMSLTRKFPVRFHQKYRLESVVGLHVQNAVSPAGPWHDLEIIQSPPTHNYRRISFNKPLAGRYLRLYKPDGTLANLSAILACRDTMGLDCIPLSVIGNREVKERYERILNYGIGFVLEPGAEDCIVHVDSFDTINSIFLIPHHDDNFVVPAQKYQLLYFSGPDGWKSLGSKTADDFAITFTAPCGALLWLRNLTKGREEQIFIWRNNTQLFNLNLFPI